MTTTPTAADKARSKAAAQRAAQRKAAARRKLLILGSSFGLVIVLAAGLITLGISHSHKSAAATRGATADTALVAKLNVPAATLEKAGTSGVTAQTMPIKVTGQPALIKDGKPQVLYVGANFCPFCAAQRWSLAVALSRFGAFHNLSTAYSSAIDVYPSTPTLSFHGATYTSDFLAFEGVETKTSEVVNGDYAPLDKLTDAQTQLLSTYDAPPYLPGKGSIPFMDFGNAYLFQGAMYSPQILAGKTPEQVAAELADSNSAVGKAVDANANAITATLCNLIGGKPGDVCTSPTIAKLRRDLDAQH